MLLSMTGFGEARLQDDRWSVAVEVRTVNNRHLKLTAKISDPYGSLEPDLERLVRETIRRGTVQLIAAGRAAAPGRGLPAQHRRPGELSRPAPRLLDFDAADASSTSAPLLTLPGVVEERKPATDDPHDDWPALSAVVSEALARLQAARAEEGRAMAAELLVLGKGVAAQLDQVAERGPEVVAVVPEAAHRAGPGAGPGPGGHHRAQGPDPRGRHPRRAGRHRRGDRPPPRPPGPVHRGDPRAGELGPQARIRRPGDGPRDQHDRLEGQRRRDQPVRSSRSRGSWRRSGS